MLDGAIDFTRREESLRGIQYKWDVERIEVEAAVLDSHAFVKPTYRKVCRRQPGQGHGVIWIELYRPLKVFHGRIQVSDG